ncbi:hypothetical protein C2G38_2288412 [Gigaspora rosea]|uniref:histidine--tRNA ligase n=1 Tax=Gigaspora rosea TaxID=44941 RepID=A0A397U865_9GLOM|nr:hypothetical protein C2G38_2288412 [Gigaspora rosea]
METDGSNVVGGMKYKSSSLKLSSKAKRFGLLKSPKTDQGTVDAEFATLLDLKKKLASITGEDGSAKSKSKFTLKTPKGTRDYNEKEMAIREKVFSTIVSVFKKHEILSGKYGEDSKLIYDLNDQGGEKSGVYDPMIANSEVVKIMCECLTAFDIGEYIVKINHRKILDGIFQICGVPDASIRPISSAVDKLDKLPWENVKKEMTEEKGLDPNIADRTGNKELLDKLFLDQSLISNNNTKTGLNDMVLLFKYLEIFGALDKISFDLSLARGLDYYTGIIYEAVAEQSGPPKSKDGNQIVRKTKKDSDELDETTVGVGSIAAGGRYDNLVGMFASNKKGNIPCVGVSIGVERVFSILLQKVALEQVKANEVEVYVMAVADGLLEDRMKICSELWDAGIKAEFMYKNKPKLQPQFSVCDRYQIPFAVIIGRDELNRGEVRIKDMRSKEQGECGGASIKYSDMVNELKKRLRKA